MGVKMVRQCPEVSHILFDDDSLFLLHANELVDNKLFCILEEYCEASDQQINFNKFSIFSAQIIQMSLKVKLLKYWKFQNLQKKVNILAFLHFLVKTNQMFSYIRERVLKKMQGWRQKLWWEILIKSVVQAIPSYSINCFLLPRKLINRIMMAVRNFWWGGDPTSKSIYWKKLDLLSKAKSERWMGFRELKPFNLALLAKQC